MENLKIWFSWLDKLCFIHWDIRYSKWPVFSDWLEVDTYTDFGFRHIEFEMGFVYNRASLTAQSVKSLPAMQKTRVWFLGQEIPGGGLGNPLQYSCWRIPWTEEPGGLQYSELEELDMTERLSPSTWIRNLTQIQKLMSNSWVGERSSEKAYRRQRCGWSQEK